MGRTWVTRRGIQVDRIACAWLIRRFVDPDASFRFIDIHEEQPCPGELTFEVNRLRVDEIVTPIAIDYLNLHGKQAGTVSRGIMEWAGDEFRILMPAAGQPRPADFSVDLAAGTLSQWRRRVP